MPRVRTGLLILDTPEGATSQVTCWNGRDEWLLMLALDLDSATGREVRARHKPSRATVLAVAADDAAHADTRTGRNVATSWARIGRRIGCHRDTVRNAQRVLRDLGWTHEVARGRHLTILERMRASLNGRPQRQAASVRALTIPARCRHLIAEVRTPAGASGNAFHPHPAGVPKRFPSPTSVTRTARKRAAVRRPMPSKSIQDKPVCVPMQRLTAALVARVPWLDTGEHLKGLARGLSRVGVTPEWTAQDVLSAVDERNRAAGLLSLPASTQTSPRALFLHQVREAITGRSAPAIARAAARQAAAAEAARTQRRLAQDRVIREANAARRAADPRPFRERWAQTIAHTAQQHTGTTF